MFKQTLCALALCFAMVLPAFAATPVNVNKADAQTIATSLDGIGLGKAQAIVAYRDAHGPFASFDDLAKVKGIGPRVIEENRERIVFGRSRPPGGGGTSEMGSPAAW